MHRALTTRTGALTLAIILAVAAALLVVVYVKGYQSDVNSQSDGVSVLVANQTIPQLTPGDQVVEATMYRESTVPKSSLVDGAVTDPDQLKGLVSGACDIAVSNTYYFARAMATDVPGLSEGIANIGWVFPNQETTGAHVNIAAAGLAAHAPHPDAAIAFLEYLSTPAAQAYFADQNFEFPAVADATIGAVPASLGAFEADDLNLSALGENQPAAQRIFNEIGFP